MGGQRQPDEQDLLCFVQVLLAHHRPESVERFLFDKLMKVAGVDRLRTSIVLKELKASTALPI